MEEQTGKCKWCRRSLVTTEADECVECEWLRERMRRDLLLSLKILGALFREQRGDEVVLNPLLPQMPDIESGDP